MRINKAIREIMRKENTSLTTMAIALGKKKGNEISARLAHPNMTFDRAIEMLDIMGYEIVIQKRTPGKRGKDQIVINNFENDAEGNGERSE